MHEELLIGKLAAPAAKAWLGGSQAAKVWQVFAGGFTLVNDHRELFSVVTPQIGAGPFHLVVTASRPFPTLVALDSSVSIEAAGLQVGSLRVDISAAALWQPGVDWARLQACAARWQPRIPPLQQMVAHCWARIGRERAGVQHRLETGLALLLQGVARQDTAVVSQGAQQLAGVGQGLTPSGDDVLMGVIYGLWATAPPAVAGLLVEQIVATAVPHTTMLSAAWLRAAGRGEAGAAWHDFSAHCSLSGEQWQAPAARILATGHSSGVAAMWGFTAVCFKQWRCKRSGTTKHF